MKIKSFVGLNGLSETGVSDETLPHEGDKIYFTQDLCIPEYYKGVYTNGYFVSDNEKFNPDEIEFFCKVDDPTAIQRLIFTFDLDFYFYEADWERWNKDGVIYDTYPNGPARVDIEDLELTKQTETLLREYIGFAESYGSFNCKDPIALHNIDQMGLFVYEDLRQELANKCYLIYWPISNLYKDTNFPMLIDNNKGNFSWVDPAVKLPELGKEVYLQLDSFTGEFKRGWLEKCGDNYFIRYKGIDYLDINRICRWQYTNE